MSAAFRNFILTFIIMLVVFGFIAYKALPDINAVLFAPKESASEPVSHTEEYSRETEVSGETSEEPAVEENNTFDCIIAAKNDSGNICSLIYVSISEKDKTYTVCRIPVDVHVNVNIDSDHNVYRSLSAQLGSSNEEYLLNKISPLVGKEIKHYIICTTASYEAFASAAEKANAAITVNLPYQVRYLDPIYADIENPGDEHYKTLSGSVTLDPENIGPVFNSYADDKSVNDYSFQDVTLGMNLFTGMVSLSELGSDTTQLSKLHASVRTDIPLSDVLKYSVLLFSYSDYTVKQLVYPTAYYSGNNNKVTVKVPNWEKGIKELSGSEEK